MATAFVQSSGHHPQYDFLNISLFHAGNLGSPAAPGDLSRVRPRPVPGAGAQEPPQGHPRPAEADLRNGGLLHALQAGGHPPDPDTADSRQPLLQAQELQDGRIFREEAAGTGAQAGGRPADQEDTPGLREEPRGPAPASVRRAQSIRHLRAVLQAHLQGQAGGQVSSLPEQLFPRVQW